MNIHDLARHLNVSIGTVSRALNGRSDVSDETRRRVLAAAETLGYSPNQSGRSLRQGATGIIGFMVVTNRERAEKGEAFFMSVFDGLQSHLATCGYDLVVLLCSADQDPNAYLRRVVERRLADAVIISDTQSRSPHRLPDETQGAVRRFRRSESGGDHAWLDLDFEGAAEQGVERLVRFGHRHIAVATSSNEVNYGYLFADACRAALLRYGIVLRRISRAARGAQRDRRSSGRRAAPGDDGPADRPSPGRQQDGDRPLPSLQRRRGCSGPRYRGHRLRR